MHCFTVLAIPKVLLDFGKLALTGMENTTVECRGGSGLALWRNGELLRTAFGNYLYYRTRPRKFGNYTCVDNQYRNSTILSERGIERLASEVIPTLNY